MDCSSTDEPITFGKNIGILRIASERADELKQLHDAIVDPNRQRSALQLLPHHMRRRAASYNPKRLPLKVRLNHQKQTEACLTDGKRSGAPSRRHRRRSRHLLEEYNRRQSLPDCARWLETHVWHAKRFHMRRHWGYSLPMAATEKTFRTCYRASARGCLARDVSFLCHVQLYGRADRLCRGLSRLGYTGRVDNGRSYNIVLFHYADRCGDTLAPVGVLWRCSESSVNDYNTDSEVGDLSRHSVSSLCSDAAASHSADRRRELLLWTHPAAFKDFIDQLVIVFQLGAAAEEQLQHQEEDGGNSGSFHDCKNVDQMKLLPRKPHMLTRYTSSVQERDPGSGGAGGTGAGAEGTGAGAEGTDGTDVVSMVVLQDKLNRLRLTGPDSQHVLQACLRPVRDSSLVSWLPDSDTLAGQADLWRHLSAVQSPAELPPRCVLALCVEDPRLFLPQKKQPSHSATDDSVLSAAPLCSLPRCAPISPFWSVQLRYQITVNKLSDNQLNRSRSEQLLDCNQLKKQLPPIPLLLLQNCHAPGWDVLVPSGWAMSFWIAFKYHGVRVGGIQESNRLALECGVMRFPDDYPDTPCGRVAEEQEKREQRTEYFKRPPSKRVNLAKLSLPEFVFSVPWRPLLHLSSDQPLRVCRCCQCPCRCVDRTSEPALVPVRLVSSGRGVPRAGALICLPEPSDRPEDRGPEEPVGVDGVGERRVQRNAWKARLASQRRVRRVLRQRNDQSALSAALEKMKSEREEAAASREQTFMPSNSCLPSRKVVGVVRFGDFCLSEAVGVGIGLVSKQAYNEPNQLHSKSSRLHVLFRNITSSQYHWCHLQPITHITL